MNKHESIRGYFAYELHEQMKKNPRIRLITGDLGYKMFDAIQEDFPDRFLNTGAAEQAMVGIAVGMAQEGLVPFVYSITPFLLFRPAETIRNYIDHEQIPVRLVGSGHDKDYSHDGFSHWAHDDKKFLDLFPNIQGYWPQTKEELPDIVERMVNNDKPQYLNLRR